MKNKVISIIKYVFAISLIVYFFKQGSIDLESIKEALSIEYVIIFSALFAASFLAHVKRFQILLRVYDIHLSYKNSLKLNLIGAFFNFTLPGSVSGDVVKGYYILKNNPDKKAQSVYSVLLDRVYGLYVLLFLAFVSICFNLETIQKSTEVALAAKSITLLFVVITIGFGLIYNKRFVGFLLKYKLFNNKIISTAINQVRTFNKKPKELSAFLLLAVISQGLYALYFYVVGNILMGHSISYSAYFLVCSIGMILTSIPISPAGIGVGQAVYLFLFSQFLGISGVIGTTAISIYQLILLSCALIGGVVYLNTKKVFISKEIVDSTGST